MYQKPTVDTPMVQRVISLATLCLGLLIPAASHACAPPVPRCTLPNGGNADLRSHAGMGVFFAERRQNGERRLVLAACKSRSAIVVVVDDADWSSRNEIAKIFREALLAEERVTLGEVLQRLKLEGTSSTRVTLPASHCGCDLPNIPPPVAHCPEDLG